VADSGGRNFFISYTAVNRSWAEWIAVQLEQAGYSTVLQAWDFRPGSDFLHQMQQATSSAGRTIAVLSPAYFGSTFGEAEWRVAFGKDRPGAGPAGAGAGAAVCAAGAAGQPGLHRPGRHRRGGGETAIADWGRSVGRPPDLGPVPRRRQESKAVPGQGPEVSNLPARNRNFSGRGGLLEPLRARLQAELVVVVVVPTGAVHGLGGVGKTELALEFAPGSPCQRPK
jgi:TIR domain